MLVLILGLSFGAKIAFAGFIFNVTGLIYYTDTNGAQQAGNETTVNSLATARAYRLNIATNYKTSNRPSANTIYAATGGDPAYFLWDVGSSVWNPVPTVGDQTMIVTESYNGLNGYTGPSYVGGMMQTIVSGDIVANTQDFGWGFTMEPIPTPLLVSSTTSSITIGFRGLYDTDTGQSGGVFHNTIASYSLYRSVDGGAYQNHGSPYAIITQNAGQQLQYTDSSASQGHTYKYKLAVNFKWTANAPAYYETTAVGPESNTMSTAAQLDHFDFALASPQNMNTPFTGVDTLTAKDNSGNVITNYNISGSNVTITENNSGGTVSGLSGAGNVVLTGSFVNGIATLSGLMTYGGLYGTRQFKATAGSVNSLSNTVTVNQGTFAKLGVNLNSPQQNAVVFTTANLSAEDVYGNIITNFDTNGESISITVNGTGLVNVVSLNKTDFIAGVADLTTKAFAFTGASGSHVFTFTSNTTNVVVTKTVQINVGAVTSVKIMDGLGSNANIIGNINVNVDSPQTYYSAGFDVSGNFVTNSVNGTWASSGFDPTDANAQVNASGVSSIVFSPHKSPQSGTISFDAGGGKTATTGTLTVVAGTAKQFVASTSASQATGANFQLSQINAYDQYQNIATTYSGSKTITLSGAGNGPESGSPTTSITATFTSGQTNSSSAITLVKEENVVLHLTQGTITGVTNSINVSAGTPNHLHATAPATVTAGTQFSITSITVHDVYGNIATNYSSPQTISCTNISSHTSPNGDIPVCTPKSITFTNGVSSDPLLVTLFKKESLTITVSDQTISGSTGNIAVGVGAAGLLEYVSGNSQSGAVNTNLTNPLIVRVKDSFGNLKSNQTVNFAITGGNGSVGTAAPTTDTSGIAQTTWRLGTVSGSNNNTVNASISGVSGSPVTFTASATPAAANALEIIAPSNATAGDSLAVTINARDSLGNIDSSFTGTKTISITGSGNGPTSGTPTYPATADFTGGSATIEVTLVKAETTTIHITSSSLSGTSSEIEVSPAATSAFSVVVPSSAVINVSFAITSIHTVDQFGNQTTDYSGTKTLSYSGPHSNNGNDPAYTLSVDFSSGNATTILATTLVTVEKTTISVSDQTISGTSNQIQAINPEAFYLEYVSGNNQTGPVGTQLSLPLIVAVRDQNGLLAPNKTITFTPSAGNVSGTLVSDDDGLVQANWTLGTTVGTQTVTASIAGLSSTVIFTSTAQVGQPAKLAFTSTPQSIRVNTASALITICLEDQYGNSALSGDDISVDLSSSSTTPDFSNSAAGPWTATTAVISAETSCVNTYYKDTTVGSYQLSASAPNFSSDSQAITIIANDLVSIEIIPSSLTIAQDKTQQMLANVYNQNDEIETDATVVWTMADQTAGAINQSGLFYPSRTSKTYPNAIKASVGNLLAFADVTITDASTSGSVVTPTPEPTVTPIIIIQQVGSSGSATTTTTTTTTTNNTTNTTNTTNNNYSIIIINNYYLGSEATSSSQPIFLARSGYPVILTPKDGTLVDNTNITVSGISTPDHSIILTSVNQAVLGTTLADKDGNWTIILDSTKINSNPMQIIAVDNDTGQKSVPVIFYTQQTDWISIVLQYLQGL